MQNSHTPMIILIGESASGKTTVQKQMSNAGIRKVITYTTRPPREKEKDGVDYHFVSDEIFNEMIRNGEFIEHASYRGWQYGTAADSCGKENTVAALTPAGLRAIQKQNIPHVSVYLNVDRRSRLIKLLQRGDDIEEAYRRSLSDVGQFDAVDREVDIVIKNTGYQYGVPSIVRQILDEITKQNPD